MADASIPWVKGSSICVIITARSTGASCLTLRMRSVRSYPCSSSITEEVESLQIYSTWTVSSPETTHYVENVTTSSSTIANLCSIIEVTQLASDFLAAQETIARQLLQGTVCCLYLCAPYRPLWGSKSLGHFTSREDQEGPGALV